MFWIELLIVLVMIFIGTRKGGPFMALAGGIGMFILTFFLHVSPSDPPITVIRIMIAVILAASAMQAAGGLDYMVRLAEKILRKHPEHITVLAPVIAYIFTFMCGTGHIVYSLLPVINEIAMDTGIRPERPIYRRRIPECHHRLPHLCGYGRHPRSDGLLRQHQPVQSAAGLCARNAAWLCGGRHLCCTTARS